MNDRAPGMPAIPRMPPHPLHANVTRMPAPDGTALGPQTSLDAALVKAQFLADYADTLANRLDTALAELRGDAPVAKSGDHGEVTAPPVAGGKLGFLFMFLGAAERNLRRMDDAMGEVRSHL